MIHQLASIINSGIIIYVWSALAIVILNMSCYELLKKAKPLEHNLTNLLQLLSSCKSPSDFSNMFKQIDQTINQIPILNTKWIEFSKHLIIPSPFAANADIKATIQSSNFFKTDLLLTDSINHWQKYFVNLSEITSGLIFLSGAYLTYLKLFLAIEISTALNPMFLSFILGGSILFISKTFATRIFSRMNQYIAAQAFLRLQHFNSRLENMIKFTTFERLLSDQIQETQQQNLYLSLIEKEFTSRQDLSQTVREKIRNKNISKTLPRVDERLNVLENTLKNISEKITSATDAAVTAISETIDESTKKISNIGVNEPVKTSTSDSTIKPRSDVDDLNEVLLTYKDAFQTIEGRVKDLRSLVLSPAKSVLNNADVRNDKKELEVDIAAISTLSELNTSYREITHETSKLENFFEHAPDDLPNSIETVAQTSESLIAEIEKGIENLNNILPPRPEMN